jgi:hypothetical protein
MPCTNGLVFSFSTRNDILLLSLSIFELEFVLIVVLYVSQQLRRLLRIADRRAFVCSVTYLSCHSLPATVPLDGSPSSDRARTYWRIKPLRIRAHEDSVNAGDYSALMMTSARNR